MSASTRIRRLAAASLALVASTGVAAAATLTESAQPGGAFAAAWSKPTRVGSGFDLVEGAGARNAYDNVVFTALPKGAQKIAIDFSAPGGVDQSYSAGGQILWSESPFRRGWDGKAAGSVQVDCGKRNRSPTLDLADSFGGTLYVALNFTHGEDLAYRISAPSNAASAPAPIPLPAGIRLIAAGWRKRAAA